jgi:hypothetical protein
MLRDRRSRNVEIASDLVDRQPGFVPQKEP